MFEIEAHNMVICTCTISDEDERSNYPGNRRPRNQFI